MTSQHTTASRLVVPSATKTAVPWGLAGLGVAMVLAVVANKATNGAIFAARSAPPAHTTTTTAPVGARVALLIESNAPGTVVTFRGTSSPAPHSEEVAESEANETVEVTASGREGRRFWLKIDRPRAMRVDLPAGSGLVDATFEETLVALGEQLATVDDAPATAAAADPRPSTASGWSWGGRRGAPAPRAASAQGTTAVVPPAATTVEARPPPAPLPPPTSASGSVKLDREDPWASKHGADGH